MAALWALPPNPMGQAQGKRSPFLNRIPADRPRRSLLLPRVRRQLYVLGGDIDRRAFRGHFDVGRPEDTVHDCPAKVFAAEVVVEVPAEEAVRASAVRTFINPGHWIIFVIDPG